MTQVPGAGRRVRNSTGIRFFPEIPGHNPNPSFRTPQPRPGDRFSLPYLSVPELSDALERVRANGGEIIHPGERWAVCRDPEGSPFGLIQEE
jgi:hypothetical protein